MMKSSQALGVAIAGILAFDCLTAAQSLAECYVRAPLRPVHRTYIRRDVVEPGVYEVARTPSVYGWTSEAAEQPGAVIWHEEPPVYRTVLVHVRQPGGSIWRKVCIHGQEGVCRVRLPSTYATVERRVVVKPGRRWAERTPPSVEYSQRRILLRPYKNYAHFQRPYIAWSREHLTIQPEGERLVPAAPGC